MNAESNNANPFRFTVEQRKSLSTTLRKNGPAADLFISDVEALIGESRSSICGNAYKSASKKARLKKFNEINGSALTLRAALQEAGPGNARSRMSMWIALALRRDVPVPDFDHLSSDEYFDAYMDYHIPYEDKAEYTP